MNNNTDSATARHTESRDHSMITISFNQYIVIYLIISIPEFGNMFVVIWILGMIFQCNASSSKFNTFLLLVVKVCIITIDVNIDCNCLYCSLASWSSCYWTVGWVSGLTIVPRHSLCGNKRARWPGVFLSMIDCFLWGWYKHKDKTQTSTLHPVSILELYHLSIIT